GGLTALVGVVGWLVERGVSLHVLDMGPGQLDVTSSQGKALLGMMAVFDGMEADRISESTKAGLAWCRANGLFCGGTPPLGRKPISTGR
ncbi:MAG: recombinase family protein, partial [bacterium]|nr:recombinase family protein [bacterium]